MVHQFGHDIEIGKLGSYFWIYFDLGALWILTFVFWDPWILTFGRKKGWVDLRHIRRQVLFITHKFIWYLRHFCRTWPKPKPGWLCGSGIPKIKSFTTFYVLFDLKALLFFFNLSCFLIAFWVPLIFKLYTNIQYIYKQKEHQEKTQGIQHVWTLFAPIFFGVLRLVFLYSILSCSGLVFFLDVFCVRGFLFAFVESSSL